MGWWTIVVQGAGPHHNENYDKDAVKMSKKFVKDLIDAGHQIDVANFTHSGIDNLKETPSVGK